MRIRHILVAAIAVIAPAFQAAAAELINVGRVALELEVNKGALLRLARPAVTMYRSEPAVSL